MAYEFLQELSESRLFRNPSKVEGVAIGNLADNFFNAAMSLQILRYENPKAAQKYAQQTLATGLDGWRTSGSDLNNLAQILMHPDRFEDRVRMDRSVRLPELQLKTWLRNIAQGKEDPSYDRQFFLALQRQLGVRSPGLQAARRLVSDWHRTIGNEKALATTRVFQGMNHDLRQSDLYAPFARVANKRGAMVDTGKTQKSGFPLWAKMAAAGVAGYAIGKKLASY